MSGTVLDDGVLFIVLVIKEHRWRGGKIINRNLQSIGLAHAITEISTGYHSHTVGH